jgi:hypothetical protein
MAVQATKKPAAAHAPLLRTAMADSRTTLVAVPPPGEEAEDTRLARKRHTSYRDVGLHALDAVHILRRVHKVRCFPDVCPVEAPTQRRGSAAQRCRPPL